MPHNHLSVNSNFTVQVPASTTLQVFSDQLQGEHEPSAPPSGISRDWEGAGTVEQAVWPLPLPTHPEAIAE